MARKHDPARQAQTRVEFAAAPASAAPDQHTHSIPVRRSPRSLLPRLLPRSGIRRALDSGSELLARTPLPAVPSQDAERRRRPYLCAVQSLADRRPRNHQGGHTALQRKPVRANHRGQVPDATPLHRYRNTGVSSSLPHHVQPLARPCRDPVGLRIVLLPVLQRHDRQRNGDRPLRSDANPPRHSHLRTRWTIPPTGHQGVSLPPVGVERLGIASILHHLQYDRRAN